MTTNQTPMLAMAQILEAAARPPIQAPAPVKPAKGARKPAKPASKPEAKPASKPASKPAKPEAKPEAKPAAGTVRFAIPGARPVAGDRLFAHTAVFLKASGMMEGKPVPQAFVARVMGDRAIKWHSAQGNMTSTKDGLTLTAQGVSKFSTRNVSAELVAAFEEVLLHGKTSDAAGVKNPDMIKAL